MGKEWSPFYWRTQESKLGNSLLHCCFGRTQVLRIFQNTPGTYPAPPSNNLWRNSFHLGVDASRLCWGSLRIVFSWGTSYKNEVCKQGRLTYDHCNPLLRSDPFMDTLQSLQPIDKSINKRSNKIKKKTNKRYKKKKNKKKKNNYKWIMEN